MYLPVVFRGEAFVFPKALADHRQGRGLYPADGVHSFSGGDGGGLRGVDAHQPVGFAPCFGGKVEVVVPVPVRQFLQSLADRLVGQRADPKAVERGGAAEIGVQVAEDKFSLAPGIGRHDDTLALSEQLADGFDLGYDILVGFVAVLVPDLSGDKDERLRDDGQMGTSESFDAVCFRHGGLHQVAECPCHGIAVAKEVTGLLSGRTDNAGDFPRYGGLFCDDCFHAF